MTVVGRTWCPSGVKWGCITSLSGRCSTAARRQHWQCGCRQRQPVGRGNRCIVMNTGLAYRARARAAIDYQVIKCTVAGTIMDIVIIAIVIVVGIRLWLRCIDFYGIDVDDHKSDGAAQPWHLLRRILPVFRKLLTYTARGVEKMFPCSPMR